MQNDIELSYGKKDVPDAKFGGDKREDLEANDIEFDILNQSQSSQSSEQLKHAHEIGTLKENRVGIDDLVQEVFASE